MPLIQWIMQNLNKKYIIQGSGGIIIYGDSIESFTEYKFSKLVKFNIGSTGYDLNGYPWTITGVHVASNEEVTYFAKTGKIENSFKNSKIVVNQLPVISNFIDLAKTPIYNLPIYEDKYKRFSQEIKKQCTDRLNVLQNCLDRPIEDLPTYQGKRTIKV